LSCGDYQHVARPSSPYCWHNYSSVGLRAIKIIDGRLFEIIDGMVAV